MMQPIWLKTLIEPDSHRPSSAPVTASGTVSMMMNGCRKLSNCAASTRNTTTSASMNVRTAPAGALELARLAVVVDLRLRRQLAAHQPLHLVERLAERIAGRRGRRRS